MGISGASAGRSVAKGGIKLPPLRFGNGACPTEVDLQPNIGAASDDHSTSVDIDPEGAAHK